MTVRYHTVQGRLRPQYVCQKKGIEHARRVCQSIPGHGIDDAIGQLLLELVTPVTLDVALAVQEELQSRLAEADRLRKQQVERARYEAEQAQHRYMQVDPRNRLVADALEADWNEKLRALREQEEDYEQQRQADRAMVDESPRRLPGCRWKGASAWSRTSLTQAWIWGWAGPGTRRRGRRRPPWRSDAGVQSLPSVGG